MADWTAIKSRIYYKLLGDRDTTVGLSNYATFDSDFCKQARDHLYSFTEQTRHLYVTRMALSLGSLSAGIYSIDTLNDSVMAVGYQAFIEINQLWINGIEVAHAKSDDPTQELSYTVRNGQPNWFKMQEPYTILFDRPLSDVELDSGRNYASGWYVHKSVSANNQTISLPFRLIDVFAEFSAAEFMRGAVSDDVALARMRTYAKRAESAILKESAMVTARFTGA